MTTTKSDISHRKLFKGSFYKSYQTSTKNSDIRRVYRSYARNLRGKNPWFQLRKDFNFQIEDLEPWKIKRIKSILEGGFLYTRTRIGVKVGNYLRLVKSLTPHGMRFIISKLPFWATSYSFLEISRIRHFIVSKRCG